MIILYIVAIIFINMIVGCFVLSHIDKDDRLYNWLFNECPPKIAFLPPLVISCWPIILYLYYKENKNAK